MGHKNFVKFKGTQLFYLVIKLTKLYQRLVQDGKTKGGIGIISLFFAVLW